MAEEDFRHVFTPRLPVHTAAARAAAAVCTADAVVHDDRGLGGGGAAHVGASQPTAVEEEYEKTEKETADEGNAPLPAAVTRAAARGGGERLYERSVRRRGRLCGRRELRWRRGQRQLWWDWRQEWPERRPRGWRW